MGTKTLDMGLVLRVSRISAICICTVIDCCKINIKVVTTFKACCCSSIRLLTGMTAGVAVDKLTRAKSNDDVEDVDKITDVVESDPDGTVLALEIWQDGPSDDEREVVDGRQCGDGQPAVVQV